MSIIILLLLLLLVVLSLLLSTLLPLHYYYYYYQCHLWRYYQRYYYDYCNWSNQPEADRRIWYWTRSAIFESNAAALRRYSCWALASNTRVTSSTSVAFPFVEGAAWVELVISTETNQKPISTSPLTFLHITNSFPFCLHSLFPTISTCTWYKMGIRQYCTASLSILISF